MIALPTCKQKTTVDATDYLADAERLITALRQRGYNHGILGQPQTELTSLWRTWEYWEFGTDRLGNDHDGLEAYEAQQDIGRDAAQLTQRLAVLWVDLEGRQ